MARICVLGPVELLDSGGASVTLAPRIRRLLAALSVRCGEVVTVDRLAQAVWGDDTPEHPGNAVQTLVSRLRSTVRAAGDGPQLLTRPEGYVLLAGSTDLDAAEFRGLLARARATTRPEDRIPVLTEALALWRGAAYGLLADEDVAREEAVALTELRAAAAADLAEAELAAGQCGAAQERLTGLVAERPYDERPALLLARCLDAAGRTGEALAVLADLRRRLRDDLGLDPSPGAAEVQRELLRPRPASRLVGLPAATEVIGRADDERVLAALLAHARLVTVLGPGGLGKTTLAFRVARQVADSYADGVVGTELGRLEPGDDIASAVCTTLQVPTGRTSPRRQLFERLRDRHLLLVLDNCEHLAAEVAGLVDRLLAECPGLTMLLTSRVSLRLPAEHVFRLDPLRPAAATELFRRRARARVRDFDAADADTEAAVSELCRRLDGLPLAIELAASRVDVITPAELLDRWSWHQSVLRGGPAGEPRHRSLTALVDWSFDRLPSQAQRIFEVVSVFAGEFSVGDVTDLLQRLGEADDPTWSLATLVDSSMLIRSPGTGRLRLLETLRAYGRARLVASRREDDIAAAHAVLFADRAVAGRTELYQPGQPGEVRRLLGAVDELRAGFGWAGQHRPALAAQIAGSGVLLVEHALLGEAVGWAETVLASDGPRDGWVCAVGAAGSRFGGDLDRAAILAEAALAAAGDDAACRAYALVVRADIALLAGDLGAVPSYRDQIDLLVSTHPELAATGQMVEVTLLLARHYDGQQVSPEEAVALRVAAERNGRSVLAAWAGYVEGELLVSVDPGRACEVLTDALDRADALGEEYLRGVALVSAASASHRAGQVETGRRLFAEVVAHWQVRGDLTHQWTTLRNVVQLLLGSDQRRDALVLAAALLVPDRAATGFGADAELLRATVERLSVDLGRPATELIARGRALRDEQVIELGLRALGQDSR